MILIEQLAEFFEKQGIGTKNTSIHPGQMPSSPDNVVVIRNSGGYDPHPEVRLANPTFQVMVRDVLEPDAIKKSWKIYAELNRKHMLKLEEKDGEEDDDRITLRWCYALAPPQSLGPDENNRILYVTNYRTSVFESDLID